MSVRGLLAATAVLLLLVAGVWYSNREEAKKKTAPAAGAAPRVLSIPLAELREVVVDRAGEHVRVERHDDGTYAILEPAKLPADVDAATALFLQFSALDTERVIDEKASNLAQFGLDPAKATITAVRKKGPPAKVLLGEKSPTGTATYAKVEGDSRVVTLSQTIAAGFEKSLLDLRDKRLIGFDRSTVKSIQISGKGPAIDLTPSKSGWHVGASRADGSAADQLLSALDAARMNPAEGPATLAANAKAWPTAAPVATVHVTDAAGAHELQVRRTKDAVYLKSPVSDGVHLGTGDLADALAKPAAQYRNMHVFDFGFDDPTRIEVKGTGLNRTLTQAEGKWSEGGKALDSIGAQSLVDKLRELKASSFASKPGAATDIELTVVSNNGQRTEHVILSKDGAAFVARREGDPGYYVLDAQAVNDLRQATNDVKAAVKPAAASAKK